MCKLLANQWVCSWMHLMCEVFCHYTPLWVLPRKPFWHFLQTQRTCDLPSLPDPIVRKQVPKTKIRLQKLSFHRPSPTLLKCRELCCMLLLHFLLASSLCIVGAIVLKKSSLDGGCVLQDSVQIPKRRQSLPSASQNYTEKLQKRGEISPSLYQRSYQSQVMQFVRALNTEPQAEFHHLVKWAWPFLNSINSFASALGLVAFQSTTSSW